MVRATQKGEMENPSPEVSKTTSSISKSDVKDFAKTKHKVQIKDVKEQTKVSPEDRKMINKENNDAEKAAYIG